MKEARSKVENKFVFGLESARAELKKEPTIRKRGILAASIATAVITLIFASLHLARLDSVVNIQRIYEDYNYNTDDVVIYDVGCAAALPVAFSIGSIQDTLASAENLANAAIQNTEAALNSINESVTASLTNLSDTVSTSATNSVNTANTAATNTLNSAQTTADTANTDFQNSFSNNFGRRLQLENSFSNTLDSFTNTANTAAQGVTNTTNTNIQAANNVTTGAITAASNITSGITDAITTATTNTLDAALDAVPALTGAALVAAEEFYSDPEEAFDLAMEIIDDCGTSESCYERGSRWSHIYLSNGLILLFILLNLVCVGIGAYFPVLRLCGACCATCLCLPHWCIVVASGAYRWQKWGRLCALAKIDTYVPTDDITDVDDTWTYEKDADMIAALFVLQLFGCFWCCFLGFYPLYIHSASNSANDPKAENNEETAKDSSAQDKPQSSPAPQACPAPESSNVADTSNVGDTSSVPIVSNAPVTSQVSETSIAPSPSEARNASNSFKATSAATNLNNPIVPKDVRA